MSDKKPLLLVDVDGVLNSFCWDWDRVPSIDDEELDERLENIFLAEMYTIYVPKGTKERMARVEELYECVWGTTWEHKAPKFLSPYLGFGADWGVVTGFQGRFKSEWGTWKLPAVRNWVEKNAIGRKLAWLDDDLQGDARKWASERRDPTLLVQTDGYHGWTEDHYKQLEEFARA